MAGLRRRAVAALIDYVLVVVTVALPLSATNGGVTTSPELPDGESVTGIGIALTTTEWLVVGIVGIVYAAVAEAFFAATVGKLVLGLRVVQESGSRLSPAGAIGRNLLRVVDGFPWFVPYVLGWAFALADSRRRRRLGDRVARSVVVRR